MSAPSDCAEVEAAYVDCFWRAASYLCDEEDGTLPLGCEAQRSAMKSCHGAGGAGGAGETASVGGASGISGEAAVGGAR